MGASSGVWPIPINLLCGQGTLKGGSKEVTNLKNKGGQKARTSSLAKMSSSPLAPPSPMPLPMGFGGVHQPAMLMDDISGVDDASSMSRNPASSPGFTPNGDNNFSDVNVHDLSLSLGGAASSLPMPTGFGASANTMGHAEGSAEGGNQVFAAWAQQEHDMYVDGDGNTDVTTLQRDIDNLGSDSLYNVCAGMTPDIMRSTASSVAACHNTNAGRQKVNIVYCTAISGFSVGCQNELPALSGHGTKEKVTKCANLSCPFFDIKQIFNEHNQYLRLCTVSRGEYICRDCGQSKKKVDGVPHWQTCPNKSKKPKDIKVAEDDSSEAVFGAPLTLHNHQLNDITAAPKNKSDSVTTDMLYALGESSTVTGASAVISSLTEASESSATPNAAGKRPSIRGGAVVLDDAKRPRKKYLSPDEVDERDSKREPGHQYMSMYPGTQSAMKEKNQRDAAAMDADTDVPIDANTAASTSSISVHTSNSSDSVAMQDSTSGALDNSGDPIMDTLVQNLSVHGIKITRLVNYDSITPIQNVAPMSPDVASAFALANKSVTHLYKPCNSTELIACYHSPRPYFPGYNSSIDVRKPYRAQDPLVCYVIDSRIEKYSQWQSDKIDTDSMITWDFLGKTDYHGRNDKNKIGVVRRNCPCWLHATIMNNGSTFACESCGKASTFNGTRNEKLPTDAFERNVHAPRLILKCTNMTSAEHQGYKSNGKMIKPFGNMAEGGFMCADHNGGCKGHDVVSSLQCYGCFLEASNQDQVEEYSSESIACDRCGDRNHMACVVQFGDDARLQLANLQDDKGDFVGVFFCRFCEWEILKQRNRTDFTVVSGDKVQNGTLCFSYPAGNGQHQNTDGQFLIPYNNGKYHKTFATMREARAEMNTNPGKYTAIIEKPINPDKGDLSVIMQYHREQAKFGTPVFKYFYPNGKPKSFKGKQAKGNDTESDFFSTSERCGRTADCVNFKGHRGKCTIKKPFD